MTNYSDIRNLQAYRASDVYRACREALALLPTDLLNSDGVTSLVNGPTQEIALADERASR